jgi:hypothetical protein
MRLAALDTKFLLAFAGGESDAEETLEYLRKNGFTLIITESVIEQLGELQRNKKHHAHDFALYASWMYPQWGVYAPSNQYVENGTSCVHAEKILDQGLIPDATKIEAEILVEASCHHCELLVTFSGPLLNAPPAPLNLALIENDMDAVTVAIASPEMIAERLKFLNEQVCVDNQL